MVIDLRLDQVASCLYRLAVKAVIVDNDKVLLVKELDDDLWSFPGGGIDHGELPEQALKRELYEEIGVQQQDITTKDEVLFVTVGQVSSGIPKANLFYMVQVPAHKVKAGHDASAYAWYTIAQLRQVKFVQSTGDLTRLYALLSK